MLAEPAKKSSEKETSWIGLALCAISLIMDGKNKKQYHFDNQEGRDMLS